MKAPNRIIPILALSVTACIPTAIAIFCAAAFDSRSESSLALLPLIGISFFAQIILQFYIGMLSPSFRSAFAISVPSCLSFGTALTVFCTRAQLLVIRRVYPAPRTAAARGLNRTVAARRTALPPLF